MNSFLPSSPAACDESVLESGVSRSQWNMFRENTNLIGIEDWNAMNVEGKIDNEVAAVNKFFEFKEEKYLNGLKNLAVLLPEISPKQCLSLIIPAYNEQEGIHRILNSLKAQIDSNGELPDAELWRATIIINFPCIGDKEKDSDNIKNAEKTAAIIGAFMKDNPQIPVEYVVTPLAKGEACVGFARMVGHDLAMLRTLSIPKEQRNSPMYLQTLDADTPALDEHFIQNVLGVISGEGEKKYFWRQIGRFSSQDKLQNPMLNVLEFFWNDTLKKIAESTDSAWTVGRGMLLSVYAHACAGGVFPFKFEAGKGVDEDLRMGIMIKIKHLLEGVCFDNIKTPIYEVDSRREVAVINDMRRLYESNQLQFSASRKMHDIATLLESYRSFNDTLHRGSRFSRSVEGRSWLRSLETFYQEIPLQLVQLSANSWRELIRTELSLNMAKKEIGQVKELYEKFVRGEMAYSYMRTEYNKFESGYALGEIVLTQEEKGLFDEILLRASDEATQKMGEILKENGVDFDLLPVDSNPPGMNDGDLIQNPIAVTSLEVFFNKLKGEFYLSDDASNAQNYAPSLKEYFSTEILPAMAFDK